MKAPKEIRQWINRIRRKHGHKNGVVDRASFDNTDMEKKRNENKRQKPLRHKRDHRDA